MLACTQESHSFPLLTKFIRSAAFYGARRQNKRYSLLKIRQKALDRSNVAFQINSWDIKKITDLLTHLRIYLITVMVESRILQEHLVLKSHHIPQIHHV